MKKKKPIIITTAVIILCIITLILGIKVVQKKKEVQTKQELIQSQQDLINYIKNDGMNVENKDIYTARIEKTTTKYRLALTEIYFFIVTYLSLIYFFSSLAY